MKKILLSLITCLSLLAPVNVCASSKSMVYLSDDLYIETIITENISTYAMQTKTGTKTNNYKDGSGHILFSVSVTGTFRYDGSSSTCTSSSVKTSVNDSNWKITSQSASKSGNKAIAYATAKKYYLSVAVETRNETVTLTCDKNGKLS